ncbi:unnamed protein product [Protopolystoma xenopodis]|uniref:Uncharacterized protein n=1 Tax=Protopolystoma xenopodis TaxID=117903 RepID=A0A448XF17_9PLAT|nr:unnamed protein product [Protopolystoma xenopodis]
MCLLPASPTVPGPPLPPTQLIARQLSAYPQLDYHISWSPPQSSSGDSRPRPDKPHDMSATNIEASQTHDAVTDLAPSSAVLAATAPPAGAPESAVMLVGSFVSGLPTNYRVVWGPRQEEPVNKEMYNDAAGFSPILDSRKSDVRVISKVGGKDAEPSSQKRMEAKVAQFLRPTSIPHELRVSRMMLGLKVPHGGQG